MTAVLIAALVVAVVLLSPPSVTRARTYYTARTAWTFHLEFRRDEETREKGVEFNPVIWDHTWDMGNDMNRNKVGRPVRVHVKVEWADDECPVWSGRTVTVVGIVRRVAMNEQTVWLERCRVID